ncbi:hypothetical protein, partial [Streptomyces griseoluteus]|uniref:hypothetical protein n=1 Tax=Streptomyces griseoluteus TaxID=29306 RepID=UPI0033C654BA
MADAQLAAAESDILLPETETVLAPETRGMGLKAVAQRLVDLPGLLPAAFQDGRKTGTFGQLT